MKIVVMEPLGVAESKLFQLAQPLLKSGNELKLYDKRAECTEELISRVKDADVVILANQPLPAEVINKCENLKMLSVAFTGVDHIDLEACRAKNITVCNAAGYSTNAVAELVFGLLINVLRNITACDARCRQGKTKEGLVGSELYGKTFGIIGAGAIGSKVAQIALAFGCRVIAYNRTEKEALKQLGVEFVSLEEIYAQADFISLHVPLTADTKGLINKEALQKMKPGAVLINTARGPVVDSKALMEALNNGVIAGAGIDVFDAEPPLAQDEVLLQAKNTVLTPHVAFASHEALLKRAEIVFANIEKWIDGTPQNLIK